MSESELFRESRKKSEEPKEMTKKFSTKNPAGKALGFSTLAVHGGEPRPKLGNSLATP